MSSPAEAQVSLPFDWPKQWNDRGKIDVLDLFSGIGGIAIGFQAAGFRVTGADAEPLSALVFQKNSIGRHITIDLSRELVHGLGKVVVGGPPCRPWSAVNVQRRGSTHSDYGLVEQYFRHVADQRPHVFLMENVPPLSGDPSYLSHVRLLEQSGYSIERERVRYSDFGVASTRTRLFTVGIDRSSSWTAKDFFEELRRGHKKTKKTVRDAIGWLEDIPRGGHPDHEWSQLKSISNYSERYRTGRFGWKQLEWDEPAPSFGSVSKTYILHPNAGIGDYPLRVLSVREVLSISGFDPSFQFPVGSPLGKRYAMAANAVSPVVAKNCARIIKRILAGSPPPKDGAR